MLTRTRKMLALCREQPLIFLPEWETTKGTTSSDQQLAIDGRKSAEFIQDADRPSVPKDHPSITSESSSEFSPIHSDYLPSPWSESDSSDFSEILPPRIVVHSNILLNKCSKRSRESSSEKSEMEENMQKTKAKNIKIMEESATPVLADHHAEDSNSRKENENANNFGNDEKKKRIRKPDFCYFCETDVLNFARHIKRNHISEGEVAKIFALKINTKERKDLIAGLRKKGNFIKNSQICSKPVRSSKPDYPLEKYVPCKHCLGFYSSKQLWRHVGKCTLNSGNSTTRFSHLTDAQNVLLQGIQVDKELADTVFPRMLADKISLVAKKDILICMFGARYLKCHREKHFINVCSRKMRELSRLLIAVMDAQPSIKSLFHALQPQNFDLIVQCCKEVSKFDAKTDNYKSPTYAMNINTSLKQCCDIAILNVLKRNSVAFTKSAAEAEADLKTMKQLLQDSWRFEVSTKAAADLNSKTWNKISIIPLATDLRIFKTYLETKSNKAYSQLEQNDKNSKAFQTLMETVFCRLLLLNRKRIGELQRMPLQVYVEKTSIQNYEEFSEAVTPTEKILLKNFKRVVIRGKRGRGVPVLFSIELQHHTQKLIELRGNFINPNNIYLFANFRANTSITGYKVMQKYATSSGAKNPTALTSTRLRKHLATISQLFSMSGNEIEQLATFMGHTSDVHKQVYRLPDDVYQTAKISKLLLLMEKGQAAQYKGKTLDEIDINMEIDLDDLDCNDDDQNELEETPLPLNEPGPSEISVIPNTTDITKSMKPKRILVPWTEEQKAKTKKFFANHIKNKKPPKRLDVIELKSQTGNLLDNKSWEQVKVFIQNQYTKQ